MTANHLLALAAALASVPAPQPPPAPPAAVPAETPLLCEGAASQRSALEAERLALRRQIGDIALGRPAKRRKPSGGEVAGAVAGTAASVLLPFGIGALLSAGARAAARSGKKREAQPGPNVEAMIERQRWLDARLAQLQACP
ncbi:MAG: hypothetical protein ACJ8ER_14730 [Allosphingosinicella sp.]